MLYIQIGTNDFCSHAGFTYTDACVCMRVHVGEKGQHCRGREAVQVYAKESEESVC